MDKPDFKAGDKVQLKEFHGRWDFDMSVVAVYLAGVVPAQYWMVQVQLGDDKRANLWATWHHFMHAEKVVTTSLPDDSDVALPCPKMKVTCTIIVDPLAKLQEEDTDE